MKLSICMMVKNESKYLEQCLESLQPIRDAVAAELIIVDTGSEDNTVEIAKKFTDRVYFHKWNNHFSEIRNITINYATGEWILIIDGDEVLKDGSSMINFLQSSAVASDVGAVAITTKNFSDLSRQEAFSLQVSPRLFRNDGHFHYEGAIHNQPIFQGRMIVIGGLAYHYGYLTTDPDLMERKFKRTSKLLKQELAKDPTRLYYWYQLSVSYAMHKDFPEAIRYIEKAYHIFESHGKPKAEIYVLVHMAQMYHSIRDYEQVRKVCLEALEIGHDYVDVYYYLGEANALLQKYEESISAYEQYFKLIHSHSEKNEVDLSVIDYTVGNQELAYFNLAQLYRKFERYEEALRCSEKLEKVELIQSNLPLRISLYLKLGRYQDLRGYYNLQSSKENSLLFYEKLEEERKKLSDAEQRSLAAIFADLSDEYGLLNQLILEDGQESFSETVLGKLEKVDFHSLPISCSDILYYLIRKKYPLQNLFTEFKETYFSALLQNIAERHEDLSLCLYEYVNDLSSKSEMSNVKLGKAMKRCLLLLNQLPEEQYAQIFEQYLADGIAYLTMIYQPNVFSERGIYEVKNDEETFLIYMDLAEKNKTAQPEAYIDYLQKALKVFPLLKRGIEIKLHGVQESLQDEDQKEQEQLAAYKKQVQTTVLQLIDNNQMEVAKQLIAEYKALVPDDMDMLVIESNLILKEIKQEPILQ